MVNNPTLEKALRPAPDAEDYDTSSLKRRKLSLRETQINADTRIDAISRLGTEVHGSNILFSCHQQPDSGILNHAYKDLEDFHLGQKLFPILSKVKLSCLAAKLYKIINDWCQYFARLSIRGQVRLILIPACA